MDDLRQKYLSAIANAADEAAIEEVRVNALGKKGEISLRMRELGGMSAEERMTAGPALNAGRREARLSTTCIVSLVNSRSPTSTSRKAQSE